MLSKPPLLSNHACDLTPQIGKAVFARSDVVIVTNASPRRELPEEIVSDIMDGLPERVSALIR